MLCNLINTILSPVQASPSTSQSPVQVSPLYRPELTTTGQSLAQTRYQYSLVTSTIQLPVEVSYIWFLTLKFINNFIFEFIMFVFVCLKNTREGVPLLWANKSILYIIFIFPHIEKHTWHTKKHDRVYILTLSNKCKSENNLDLIFFYVGCQSFIC